MNRNELISKIRDFLAEKDHVTAPGLVLLTNALAELERESTSATAAPVPAYLRTAETFTYDLMCELAILPERDEEPAPTLQLALQADPELCDKALRYVVSDGASTRFVDAVRELLGAKDVTDLNQLYGLLQGKAEYLEGLVSGISERDQKLLSAENILSSCLEAAVMDWQDIKELPAAISRYVTTARMHEAEVQVTRERVQPDDSDDVIDPDVHLVHQRWLDDAVDLAHAVAGNLAPENRVMAKAARHLIKTAPREA